MRLAIADPPYLGRANRWYGTGRGIAGGRGRADSHPDAGHYDTPSAHVALIHRLCAEFDGWGLFLGVHALRELLPRCPETVRVLSWVVPNAPPSGSRVATSWEPVLVQVPPGRRAHGTGPEVASSCVAAAPRLGFVGAKPPEVTHWLLDVLGFDADADTVTDLFPGSGSVAAAVAQGRIPGAAFTSSCCERCGQGMSVPDRPQGGGRWKRYCSTRCRTAAHRAATSG